MSNPDYILGIDLGTTNSALAFVELAGGSVSAVSSFLVPQLVRVGEVASLPLLPSCLYLPGEHELPADTTRLPWGESPGLVVGELARWQGVKVPGRLVASAKSWLCHSGVDRSACILPWGAPAEVAKISPVEASARILSHLAAAWDHAHPSAPMRDQEVILTIPASFDEAARALTVAAARQSGLVRLHLVEEPQAAFQDFIFQNRNQLDAALDGVRLVLVIDVGGGTTDFTLIQVVRSAQGVELRRIAVGEHLMLGGDNMDAALARCVEEKLFADGRKLGAAQWHQLTQAARSAKEKLLGTNPPQRFPIAIAGGGSRLLGSTLTAELGRDEAAELLLKGFFPEIEIRGVPSVRTAARMALQELGLPYAQDPAITRHLAVFLNRHAKAGWEALESDATGLLPRPDAILLNGGVFNSATIASRLVHILSGWWPESPAIRCLEPGSLEVAVARGAVAYGLARRGLERKIGGGAAHAFYVGIAGAKPDSTPRAICLIPRGQEEGALVDLQERSFTLTLGRPVQFPLYSTTSDREDRPGDIVEVTSELHALPPTHTLLKGAAGGAGEVPVHLQANLTELGTLELWCVSNRQEERWKLEFDLRGSAGGGSADAAESLPPRFGEVKTALEKVFGARSPACEPKEVRQLFRTVEGILGSRESWPLAVLREVWSLLIAGAAKRRRSADHERVYFQMLGYSLRPGFGFPLDDWRCAQTFRLFSEGVNFHSEQPNWNEFWVLWRRIAGGLSEADQLVIWTYLKPHLARRIPFDDSRPTAKPKGIQPEGLDEMVRVAASLENLPVQEKELLGEWLLGRLKNPATAKGPWTWALGRVGARWPMRGSGHQVLSPDLVAPWLAQILEIGLSKLDGAIFSAVSLARMTGDRNRDIEEELRQRIGSELERAAAPERWRRMLTEVVELEASDEARSLGDTLPIGLRIR